jgi:hypothetical protein
MPITLYNEYLLECFNIPKLFNGLAKYELQTAADKQADLVREFNRHVLPKLKKK